mmetsp:Transcript_51745/g.116458  ORF Transcript_51745/g.116458 Transcript_51745/m.116458 type:complete len:239 (-) Transcript_51745:363-1079(-)
MDVVAPPLLLKTGLCLEQLLRKIGHVLDGHGQGRPLLAVQREAVVVAAQEEHGRLEVSRVLQDRVQRGVPLDVCLGEVAGWQGLVQPLQDLPVPVESCCMNQCEGRPRLCAELHPILEGAPGHLQQPQRSLVAGEAGQHRWRGPVRAGDVGIGAVRQHQPDELMAISIGYPRELPLQVPLVREDEEAQRRTAPAVMLAKGHPAGAAHDLCWRVDKVHVELRVGTEAAQGLNVASVHGM